MYKNLMIDLETLSTAPDAVILSMGAVAFDERAHLSGQPNVCATAFYRALNIEEQKAMGRRVDESTMAWWAQQSPEARAVFDEEKAPVRQALEEFGAFIAERTVGKEFVLPWGNGADFDLVLLSSLHQWRGVKVPWRYHNHRCFRTLKNLLPEDYAIAQQSVDRIGHHNALADAAWQAKIASILLRRLDEQHAVCSAAVRLNEACQGYEAAGA